MKCVAMLALAALPFAAHAQEVLWDNGPIVTNPTGGTGTIAGLPISNCDGFTMPGQTFIFSTTGVGAAAAFDNALADDFTVACGETWVPTSLKLYAFRNFTSVPAVTAVKVNLWSAPPFNANSPLPHPDPLPAPMLAQSITVPVTAGALICHRQSVTSTSTNRPVHEYVVDVSGLPQLASGTYWIEFSFVTPALTSGQNMHVPLVSPRSAVEGHNARQYSALDGQQASPRSWFEGREGYVAGVQEGRAFELPFVLEGSRVAPSCSGNLCGPQDFNGDGDSGTDQDIEAFFACLGGNCCCTCFCQGSDFNGDGDFGTDQDIEAFFRVLGGGGC
ncbi:MAG TPA: hypothetical protein VD997_12490 [Phycisphaerales bacterium]|nr:hypothetical protein [Phycisphaerales bacterium]